MSLPLFQTFPLTTAAGAEIQGLDLSAPLSEDTTKRLRRIWLRHGVLFFRNQNLYHGQLLKVAKAFGETMPYPLLKGLEGFPEVTVVSKMEQEEMNFGGIWHSDTAYLETPRWRVTYALEVPEHGGDTLFANQALAYESLSEAMKDLLCGLTAINIAGKPAVMNTRSERIEDSGSGLRAEQFSANHPAVRTHPETGTKAIYVNRLTPRDFWNCTEKEGKAFAGLYFRTSGPRRILLSFQVDPWNPRILG